VQAAIEARNVAQAAV